MKLNTVLVICLFVFGVLETISALRKRGQGRGRKHRKHHGNLGNDLPYGPPGMKKFGSHVGAPGWTPNVHSPERFSDRMVGPPASNKLASLINIGSPATMDVRPPGVRANSPAKLSKLILNSGSPAHMVAGPPAGSRSSSPVVGPPADNYGPPGSKLDSIIGPPAGAPGGMTHQDMQSLEPGCPPGESFSVLGGCVPMLQNMEVACPPGSKPDPMRIGCIQDNAQLDMASYMRRLHVNSDPVGPVSGGSSRSSASIVGPPSSGK